MAGAPDAGRSGGAASTGGAATSGRDVAAHYTVDGLYDRIVGALTASGRALDALTVDDLAPVDAFHIRGRAATEELLAAAALHADQQVLDVGCGLGGTSRYLADRVGCRVTGVDLTAAYCELAERLSGLVGLGQRTRFRNGSALALPFADGRFDVAWTEHVQMNIADKARFYGECVRVLAPGGQLVFHDIFAGSSEPLDFPVPWASEPSISHLATVDELERIVRGLGLERVHWEDTTEASTTFFETVVARVADEGWMPLGLQLLMGDTAEEKFTNMLGNLRRGRLRVVAAVLRPGGAR